MDQLAVRRWGGKLPVGEEDVARQWASEGFSCGCWVDPPGRSWLDFVHEADERILLKEGSLHVEVEGKGADLQPGDEVFVPAGHRHSVSNCGGTQSVWLYGYRRNRCV